MSWTPRWRLPRLMKKGGRHPVEGTPLDQLVLPVRPRVLSGARMVTRLYASHDSANPGMPYLPYGQAPLLDAEMQRQAYEESRCVRLLIPATVPCPPWCLLPAVPYNPKP
eukprot:114660-Pyramimonas_sp.AAC.1